MEIDQRDISLSFGFWRVFLDFGVFLDFWLLFVESEWSHFGGQKADENLSLGYFPDFLDFGGSFWILDFLGKIFGIRMVTFWWV